MINNKNQRISATFQNGATANLNKSPSQENNAKHHKSNVDHHKEICPLLPDYGTPQPEIGKDFIFKTTLLTAEIESYFSTERERYDADKLEKTGVVQKLIQLDNKILNLKTSYLKDCVPSTLKSKKIPSKPFRKFGRCNIVFINCGGTEFLIDADKILDDSSELFGQIISGPFNDCFMKDQHGNIFLDLNPLFF